MPPAQDERAVELGWRERYELFFFSSRRRHTRLQGDWSSDVCSSDLFRNRKRKNGKLEEDGRWCARRRVRIEQTAGEDDLGRANRGGVGRICNGRVCGEIGRASCRERV